MSSGHPCAGLSNNPDISGKGVRISFYLQTFLLVLLVDRSWQDAPAALWTFISTSFGLTVAAVVQASFRQLSFFQALQVSNLVWLANFGTFLALASYSRRKANSKSKAKTQRSDNFVKLGATLQTLLSMALTLYMWTHASAFESPECVPTIKYVIFAFNIPVVGSGRRGALAVTSILTVAYVGITLRELWSFCHDRRRQKKRRMAKEERKARKNQLPSPVTSGHSLPSPMSTPSMPAIVVTPSANGSHLTSGSLPVLANSLQPTTRSMTQRHDSQHSEDTSSTGAPSHRPVGTTTSHQRHGRPKRRRWFADFDPMFLGITTFQGIIFTYFIVSGELLLSRNPTTDDIESKQWGFGQILAIIIIIPSTFSVIQAFYEHGMGRLHRRRKARHTGKSKPEGQHDGA